MYQRRERRILNEIGNHDQYSTKYDVFVLDGCVVSSPGGAKARCRNAGLNSMETRIHLSRLVQSAPTA